MNKIEEGIKGMEKINYYKVHETEREYEFRRKVGDFVENREEIRISKTGMGVIKTAKFSGDAYGMYICLTTLELKYINKIIEGIEEQKDE